MWLTIVSKDVLRNRAQHAFLSRALVAVQSNLFQLHANPVIVLLQGMHLWCPCCSRTTTSHAVSLAFCVFITGVNFVSIESFRTVSLP